MRVPLSKPWITHEEAQAAYDVVKSCWLVHGPKTEEFEHKFSEMVGCKHALAVNSGSSALWVSQMALGIGPGDEVIIPNMTFIATANSCLLLGATPVFCDIQLDHYGIDCSKIKELITPKTKAIIPVHYAGQSCDIDQVVQIATENNLYVIEDAAEAHLAEYQGQKVGTFGDLGIFSFTPTKLMTTGEGGMIVTNDDQLAEKIRLIRNFGDQGKFQWVQLGFNFRMPEVMGAIGIIQLQKLPKAIILRRGHAHYYSECLSQIEGIIPPYERHPNDINYQLYTIRIDPNIISLSNHEMISRLQNYGIQARLYYPCLHSQPVFGRDDSVYPASEHFQKTALSLPMYATMQKNEIDYVVDSISKIASFFRDKCHNSEDADAIEADLRDFHAAL